jgi:hypothetical protein
MSNSDTSRVDIENWWSRKAFMQALACSVLSFICLIFWVEKIKPEEGRVFERLPPIAGIWKCCKGDGRYGESWVGIVEVSCGLPGYFPATGGAFDCGIANVPNGQLTVVTKAKYPALNGEAVVVVKIESNGKVYYDRNSDAWIREKWISVARSASLSISIMILVFFYIAQLMFLTFKKVD